MFISLSRTCIRISVTGIPFLFFITSCSRSGMKWDTTCRPTDDPFWASAQGLVQPPNNICLVLAAEKNIYMGHSSKKDNHPFHSKAFVLLYKFETSWALLGRLSRFFFFGGGGGISAASNFLNILNSLSRPFWTWLASSGNKIQKKGWKIYSRTRTFGAEVHKSNVRVKRWHNKYENSELDWKPQLLFKWFAY